MVSHPYLQLSSTNPSVLVSASQLLPLHHIPTLCQTVYAAGKVTKKELKWFSEAKSVLLHLRPKVKYRSGNLKGIEITGITNKTVPICMFLLGEKTNGSFIYSINIYQVLANTHHWIIPFVLCGPERYI